MSFEAAAAIAANRFGLGARPGICEYGSDPARLVAIAAARPALHCSPPRACRAPRRSCAAPKPILAQRRAARRADTTASPQPMMPARWQQSDALAASTCARFNVNDARARWRAAVDSDRPFAGTAGAFLSNHFAVRR